MDRTVGGILIVLTLAGPTGGRVVFDKWQGEANCHQRAIHAPRFML
jgi:hypothetical protein